MTSRRTLLLALAAAALIPSQGWGQAYPNKSIRLVVPFGTGVEAVTGTPEEFTRYIRGEVAKWLDVVKASGAELE